MIYFKTIGFCLLSMWLFLCPGSDLISDLNYNLPQNWTQLSRTETGFVVYDPCDGSTPTIKMAIPQLIINGQLESEQYIIMQLIKHQTGFNIKCEGLDIYVKWLDKKKIKAVWKFNYFNSNAVYNYKIVMCPAEYTNKFLFVNNPCPKGKIDEKKFLSVDHY